MRTSLIFFLCLLKKKKSLHFYLLNFMLEYVHELRFLEYVHEWWGFEVCKICCWFFFFFFFWETYLLLKFVKSIWFWFFFKITMHICRFEFWFKLWNLLLVIPLFLLNMVVKQVIIDWWSMWLTKNLISLYYQFINIRGSLSPKKNND